MNRIYQGRVSRIQILRPLAECGCKRDSHHGTKPEHWAELASDREHARTASENLMWAHHALFQDAVNYYLVCLLALANGGTKETKKIVELRDRLTREPDRNQPDYDKAQHFYIWGNFQRRGANRPGLRDSVAKYLTPGNLAPTFAECAAAALAGNPHAATPEGRALLDRGLAQLLGRCKGASGCRNSSKEYLPRFCRAATKCNYPESAISLRRDYHEELLRFALRDARSATDPSLDHFGVFSLALPEYDSARLTGTAAQARLAKMIEELRKHEPEHAAEYARLTELATRRGPEFALPNFAGTSVKGAKRLPLFALYLFRYVERSEFTFQLLRRLIRPPSEKDTPPTPPTTAQLAAGDPVQRARGSRGYVFRAFTALPEWHGDDPSEPQWLKFDEAALQEALKALHQVDAKNEEREKERKEKIALHEFKRQIDFESRQPKRKRWKEGAAEKDTERPPVFAGDERIARLEWLLSNAADAGGLAAEYEMAEGAEVKYGLQPRTIRGFHDLRKKWLAALEKDVDATRIAAILADFKKDNAETIGSPALFDALARPENWLIWRTPTADETARWRRTAKLPDDTRFADDPLQAFTDECELLAEIEDLTLSVRLTPADPEHSRRQFYFSDVTSLTSENRLRHNQPWIDVEIARVRDGKFAAEWVRLHFTAPRLLRDQLTAHDTTALPWQQPMMAALDLSQPLTKDGKPATFEECAAVALMPEGSATGPKRILLNFPIEIDADSIAKQLGKQQRWTWHQFGGTPDRGDTRGESYWLRWEKTWLPEKKDRKQAPPPAWWHDPRPWSCLSIDLGQRDAGAYAVLEASPDAKPKPQSRQLGVAAGRRWWATVRAMGSLRLPGEDAKVFRDGKPQEELYGERGRSLVIDTERDEWAEAQAICRGLGFDPDKLLGTEPRRYSFPELNGELLYALRRAQARLARLQSWSCVAHEPPEESKRPAFARRRDAIVAELRAALSSLDTPVVGQELPQCSAWLRELVAPLERGELSVIAARVVREILDERARIQSELVRIADRIQPLRRRRWIWMKRADGENHWLQPSAPGTDDRRKLLAGQRGLSIERIEQLESLRQRCQSLNRALRQTPGEPAGLGRGKRGIELPDPCTDLRDRLEALKEQRVNQTAHLILAQALGVRLKAHATDPATRRARDLHGEYERIPGRAPVDFVVLENLDRYLANQGRSKAENSRLMKWCHRAILGKLKQLCEPYGLRVVETPAAYSSQFCSLTGGPGFRAIELTPDSFREHRWKRHLDRLLEESEGKRRLDPRERLESETVRALHDASRRLNHDLLAARDAARAAGRTFRPKWRTLLAPVAGGPIFVPLHGHPMQADLNAAINIGLRAIAAPDTGDIHVRIRAERKDDGFVVRAENVREKARWGDKPPAIDVPKDADRKKLLTESHLNFFADARRSAGYDHAVIAGDSGYASGHGLFGTIKGGDHHLGQNWLRCGTLNNDRLEKEKLERPLPQQEDVKWE